MAGAFPHERRQTAPEVTPRFALAPVHGGKGASVSSGAQRAIFKSPGRRLPAFASTRWRTKIRALTGLAGRAAKKRGAKREGQVPAPQVGTLRINQSIKAPKGSASGGATSVSTKKRQATPQLEGTFRSATVAAELPRSIV